MKRHTVYLLIAIVLDLWLHVKGQNVDACTSLDSLIANRVNSEEVNCQRRPDCAGINCFSRNSFLENFIDLFEIRVLPCAMPSPAIRLLALSREDAANNNERSLVRNETLTNTSSTRDLEIRSGGGDLLFGTYQFSANFSESNSSIGFAVLLVRNGATIWVVNYTLIPFDSASCSMPTTTTTTTTPASQMQGTTTTMQSPSASDDPRATNDSIIATPTTAMNNDTLPLGTSRGVCVIPRAALNIILVLLTMLVMATLVV